MAPMNAVMDGLETSATRQVSCVWVFMGAAKGSPSKEMDVDREINNILRYLLDLLV
jgi:hypothetical protein